MLSEAGIYGQGIKHQRSQWVVCFLAEARFGANLHIWVILSYQLEVFRPRGFLAGQSGIQRVNAAACTAVEARQLVHFMLVYSPSISHSITVIPRPCPAWGTVWAQDPEAARHGEHLSGLASSHR